MSLFKHVLVPIDFSDSSGHALDLAIELALAQGAALTLVHVYEIPTYPYPGFMLPDMDFLTPVQQAAQKALDDAVASTRIRVPEATGILRPGDPAQEIVHAIEETHADLVVIGTHGRRGFSRALVGSVAEKTVRLSPVPVLTVRSR